MGEQSAVEVRAGLGAARSPLRKPSQRFWPATPMGVRRARHVLTATLTEWGLPADVIDASELVLSELAGNAVKHALTPGRLAGELFETRCEWSAEGVRIEVHDARTDRRPVQVQAADSDEQGRGLAIVDAITGGKWGFGDREGLGKVVWALCPGECAKEQHSP